MFKKMQPHERGYAGIMNALAEAALELDDQTILAEASDQGEDPIAAAGNVRDHLRYTSKFWRQRFLRQAADEHKRLTSSLSTRWVDLPDSADERRSLLTSIMARNPSMQSAFLTVQHRDFKELSDADVESCLAQLAELGIFDDDANDEDDK